MSHVAVENALSLDQQVRDGPRERAGGWVGEGRSVNRDMGGGVQQRCGGGSVRAL